MKEGLHGSPGATFSSPVGALWHLILMSTKLHFYLGMSFVLQLLVSHDLLYCLHTQKNLRIIIGNFLPLTSL